MIGFHTKNMLHSLLVVLLFATLAAGPAVAQSTGLSNVASVSGDKAKENGKNQPEQKQCDEGEFYLDFVDTDIREIVKSIGRIADKNFLIDSKLSGKITLISPVCVSKYEAYEILLSVLEVNNMTVVSQDKIHKIVQKPDIIRKPITTNLEVGRLYPDSDKFVTQLIPLTNISAETVQSMFSEFTSPEGRMISYSPSNTLIMVDTEANIARLLKILTKLDVEGIEETIEVITLKFASAAIVSEQITMLFPEMSETYGKATTKRTTSKTSAKARRASAALLGKRETSSSKGGDREQVTSIISDLRTNSLIVRANKLGLRRIRELVQKLDVTAPGGEGNIHVYRLQNADAEEVAVVLQGLAGGGTGATGSSRSQQSKRTTSTASRAMQGLAGAAGMAGMAGAAAAAMGGTGFSSTTADFEGGVRVTADPNTNSLVIVASNRDYQLLKGVIQMLDIKRRQVYVEAMILEISMDKGRQLGFEFRSTNDPSTTDGIQILGGSNYGNIANAAANPLGIAGLAIGAADGTISFGGTEYPNIGALFTALQTDSDVNVLSTPTILTTDNEEAEIVVADNIPFVTGQLFSQANNNPVTTIERQDVGITLRLTPQINESNRVTLQIEQEVSNVAQSPEGLSAANVGVTTSKRTAKTVVVVKDMQTVVIGGLMKDNTSVAESKVPLLGDIPILGYLFKNSKRTVTKTNLVIFLTPYIIRDDVDFEDITRMRFEEWKRFKEENQVVKRKNEDRYPDEEKMKARPDEEVGPVEFTITKPPIDDNVQPEVDFNEDEEEEWDPENDAGEPEVVDPVEDDAEDPGSLLDDEEEPTAEETDGDEPILIEEEGY